VSHDDDGPAGPVSHEPRNDRSSTRRRLEQTRVDPLGSEHAVEILRHGELVTGRIHRVDADHALQMDDRLASDGRPIDRVRFGGFGGGRHVRVGKNS